MNNLKELREKAGISKSGLARLVGLSRQSIYDLEGESVPMITTAYAMANILGVSIYDIWPDTTEIEVEKVTIRRVKK